MRIPSDEDQRVLMKIWADAFKDAAKDVLLVDQMNGKAPPAPLLAAKLELAVNFADSVFEHAQAKFFPHYASLTFSAGGGEKKDSASD